MGRTPCCEKNGLKKGPWTPEEDQKLINYIERHGHGSWRALPKRAELLRCGKSCRLRWTNYLRPDIKRGKFSFEEEHRIIELHAIIGNKWSTIAASLPGRTDNEIKNYWNTHLRKRLIRMGIDPVTHRPKTDMIGFSSMSATSLFPSADLNHILGRQTALMENEEFLKHVIADMMMPKNRTESELAVMRSLASQFGQKKSAADLAWAQQPAIGLDFNGLPQTSEHYAQAQTNGCSTDILMNPEINVDHCLNKDHEESVSRFLESCMYSSGFDKSPSPLQMEHHGQHASPSSTLISSVNGPQMKIKQENIPQSEIFVQDQNLFHSDQILCNQTVLNNGIIDLNNEFWKEKMKPASAAIGFSCPNGLEDCKLYSSPMLLPVQGNCAYGSSVNPPEFMLQFGDNSNANVLSNSSLTRHETPGSSEINSEDSNHYWSTMLIKAVGTNPNHPTVLWQ